MKAKPAVTMELVPHPKSMMLPELSEKDYQALKASIAAEGQKRPIQILKGTPYVVDGRHRLRATRELNITPKYEVVEIAEHEVAVYIAAEAVKRPGLTPSQKVVIAVDLIPAFEERAAERQRLGEKVREGEKGKAAEQVAALVGVSSRYVEAGLKLIREHSDLFEQVRREELSLAEAKDMAAGKEPKPKARPRCKQCDGGLYLVPERLRERLAAVGSANLGEDIEALLNFIEREGREAWERRDRAPSTGGDDGEDSGQVMAAVWHESGKLGSALPSS